MVSVIIPNYNHSLYLKERIDSILNQTYEDFEIILLDDKSTDNSLDVLLKYEGVDKITQLVCNTENSGSTFKQWNKGVSLAKGDYVLIAESDDFADTELLATLMSGIKSNDNIVLAYCQSYKANSNSQVTGDWGAHTLDLDPKLFENDFIMDGLEFISKFLIFKNVIPNASAVLFKKDVFLEVGGADTTIKYCSDWHCWMKMLTKGNMFFTANTLNYFRYHEDSVIAKAVNVKPSDKYKYDILMRMQFDSYLLACPIFNKKEILLDISRKQLRKELKGEAKYQLFRGEFRLAKYYYSMLSKYGC